MSWKPRDILRVNVSFLPLPSVTGQLLALDDLHRQLGSQFIDFHFLNLGYLTALINEAEQRALVH